MNARSLQSKYNELVARLSDFINRISFILITETWFNSTNDAGYEIPGYKSLNVYRDPAANGNSYGGLKLYYLDHLSPTVLEESNTGSCEFLLCKFDISPFGDLIICCVYRPPNKSLNDFNIFLENKFDRYCSRNFLFFGDTNVNTLDRNNTSVASYENLFESYGLINEISVPTYINPSTYEDSSCLDHILHNLKLISSSYCLKPNLSDHYAVIVVFDFEIKTKPIDIKFRDYSQRNVNRYLNNVEREFSMFSPNTISVQQHALSVLDFLKKLMDKYFPIKHKSISKKRLHTPWLTNDIRKCINKKHRWLRMVNNNIITLSSYKNYCKALSQLIYISKTTYYKNKLSSLNHDMRKNWKILNRLLNKQTKTISSKFISKSNNQIIIEPLSIANEFNDHFVRHPMNIQNNIKTSRSDYLSLVSFSQNNFHFDPCTEHEVGNEISRIRKSGNIHDISGKFLKLSVSYVSCILSNLFNHCFFSGIFPDKFKYANITPVYKKGTTTDITNYRPISVIENISKLLESLMHKRLSNFFNESNLLNSNQYGFRKKKNTEMAIFTVLERIIPAFENRNYAICVFLDFSACFDTISREILLEKLYRYGCRDKSLDLITSYFYGRKQRVNFENASSRWMEQTIGVIQGSKNGPLWYDLYTSDLKNICTNNEYVMFADDTCLVYSGENLDRLVAHVNERLSIIFDWCCYNKLSLNPEKCRYMLFTNKNVPNDPVIKIESDIVERAKSFKYLGVIVDDKLKYQDHIAMLCTRLARVRGITFNLRKHLDIKAAKNVYYTCVYSILTYCICTWGGVFQETSRGDRLLRLQKGIMKNLFKDFHPNASCLFKSMHILKLNDIHKLYASIYMFKVLKLNLMPTVQENLNLNFPNHEHYLRNYNDPRVPLPRVASIRLNYKHQCISIWNSLPENMKAIESFKQFKKCLIQVLLDQY